MRKIFITLLLALLASPALAVDPGDIRLTQRNDTNTANLTRDLSFPAASANGILVLNGSTVQPQAATLTGGLVFNGTSLTTSAIPQSNVSGLVSALSGKQDALGGTTAQYVRGDGSLATYNGGVGSFNGRTGSIVPSANDYALADITGLSTALSGKVANSVTVNGHALSSNVTVTKSDVGLGNVDNTADSSKTFAASQTTSGTFDTARIPSLATSKITGLDTALVQRPIVYDGVTQKSGVKAIFKSATVGSVSSGNAVFYLTSDNTSTGTALCTNTPYVNAMNFRAVEGSTPHAFGDPVVSNSNRTITVPVSKLGTVLAVLALNQSAAGSVVAGQFWCD